MGRRPTGTLVYDTGGVYLNRIRGQGQFRLGRHMVSKGMMPIPTSSWLGAAACLQNGSDGLADAYCQTKKFTVQTFLIKKKNLY